MPQRRRLFAVNGKPDFEVPVNFQKRVTFEAGLPFGDFLISETNGNLHIYDDMASVVEIQSADILLKRTVTIGGNTGGTPTGNLFARRGFFGPGGWGGVSAQSNLLAAGEDLGSTVNSASKIANFGVKMPHEASIEIWAERVVDGGTGGDSLTFHFEKFVGSDSWGKFLSMSPVGLGVLTPVPAAAFHVTDYGVPVTSLVYSNQSSTDGKTLHKIHNDHASATGAIPLEIVNDAVIATHFKLFQKGNGITYYTSSGTSPNGLLEGVAGDRCHTPTATFICAGGNSWS